MLDTTHPVQRVLNISSVMGAWAHSFPPSSILVCLTSATERVLTFKRTIILEHSSVYQLLAILTSVLTRNNAIIIAPFACLFCRSTFTLWRQHTPSRPIAAWMCGCKHVECLCVMPKRTLHTRTGEMWATIVAIRWSQLTSPCLSSIYGQ
jgi:hypothetical protein